MRSLRLRDFISLFKVITLAIAHLGASQIQVCLTLKSTLLINVLYYLLNGLQIPPISKAMQSLLL